MNRHFDTDATYTRESTFLSDLRKLRGGHDAYFKLFAFFTVAAIYMALRSHVHGDLGSTLSFAGATLLSATVTLMQWVERNRLDRFMARFTSAIEVTATTNPINASRDALASRLTHEENTDV